MIRSGGFIFALVMIVFLAGELYVTLKVCDVFIDNLGLVGQEPLRNGYQRIINPVTGYYDNNVYYPPPQYKPYPFWTDKEAELCRRIDRINRSLDLAH